MAAEGNPTTFVTLTVNPQRGESQAERARDLSDALKVLIKRARRKWTKGKIEYLAVFEATKRGEPHLHVLMRAPYVPQKWLSRQMDELIEAPIVDIRHVHSKKHAATYVAKYVGKGPKSFGTLKRYWCSQGYSPKPATVDRVREEFEHRWYVVRRSLWMLADEWSLAGLLVIRAGEHEIYSPNRHPPPGLRPGVPWRDIIQARHAHGSH